MSIADRFQTMAVDRTHTLTLDGPAGSSSRHVVSTLCMDSHLKSPPPMAAVADPLSGDELGYSVTSSPLAPILEAVTSLRPQLVDLAEYIGMPEQMYVDTVTQWATWAAAGSGTEVPFTRGTPEAMLGAALAAAGRGARDEERE